MSLNELLEYSKTGQKKAEENDVLEFLEHTLDEFFWGLNNDKQYESETYGGEIELGFHPSALAGANCARKLMYDYFQVPTDSGQVEPKLRRIFDNGHDCHDRWQRYFTMLSQKTQDVKLIGSWKCRGCSFIPEQEKEIEIPTIACPKCGSTRWKYAEYRLRKKDLRITGKRDGKLLIKGKPFLLEIKSMGMFPFQKLFAPTEAHKKQFTFYQMMDKTKDGLFLYEDKNSQQVKMFYHKYDKKIIEKELLMLIEVNKNLDSKTLPDRLQDYSSSKTCKLCAYRKLCFAQTKYEELFT